jgi:hypothetical protein
MRQQTLAELGGFFLGKSDAPVEFEAPRFDDSHAVGVAPYLEVFRVLRVNLCLLRIMVRGPRLIGSEDFHNSLSFAIKKVPNSGKVNSN